MHHMTRLIYPRSCAVLQIWSYQEVAGPEPHPPHHHAMSDACAHSQHSGLLDEHDGLQEIGGFSVSRFSESHFPMCETGRVCTPEMSRHEDACIILCITSINFACGRVLRQGMQSI